jgi:hypothetical protein
MAIGKQITYVIIDDEGDMYNGHNATRIFWTQLITETKLFQNLRLAEKANKVAQGIIKKMTYNLEDI